nr:uncharacterized protein LOC116773234 [Danaus plexippus plexippus]
MCTSRVKLENTGPTFPVERSVPQGDPLSPRIFIAILETALSELDWNKKGLYIKGKYLSHLRFADDLVLFSEANSQLQGMIEDLCNTSRQVGLEINISKTKLMSNGTKEDINLDGNALEYVEQNVYLGKQVGFGQNSNELEKGMERSMLNISKIQKMRHTDIRSKTKTKDALNHALKLKWKWAGHVARLQDNRRTKLQLEQDLKENAAEDDVSHAGKKMLKKELAPNGSG